MFVHFVNCNPVQQAHTRDINCTLTIEYANNQHYKVASDNGASKGNTMKKICMINGNVIALDEKTSTYSVFTKEEYAYGEGYRYPEFDGMETIEEAKEQARDL